jgi:hypothetical protein
MEDPTPAIFWPLAQNPDTSTLLLVRSHRPTSDMIPAVRHAIADVDSAVLFSESSRGKML